VPDLDAAAVLRILPSKKAEDHWFWFGVFASEIGTRL
jgi:hypothetical protein